MVTAEPRLPPDRLSLSPGESVTLPLPARLDAGHRWHVEATPTTVVTAEIVSTRVEPGPAPPAGGEPPGSGGVRVEVVVTGVGVGEGTVRLTLARPFGDRTPLARHTVHVTVT